MSPIGKRTDLSDRLDALEAATDTARKRLPDDIVKSARGVLERAGKRRGMSRAHTVVALAGATGGGKSTLFNLISGMNISPVGVRRPTTSYPMACVWGTLGVAPLLDWLGVPRRHQIARESVLDSGAQDELDGLVLLDLPDHDSTEYDHRLTVERLIELVDVFVWVVDPEKYADAALHERYLRPLASHRAVTAVILNQIDRLSAEDVKRCVTDLRELLDKDGLTGVPVLPMSAATGTGVDQFTDLLRNAVSKQRAFDDRIAADVRVTAKALAKAGGDAEPGSVGKAERLQLVAALAEAAGVDIVADAVGRSYLGRARAATGWPLTRWLGKLRRDPLRSLGLGRKSAPELTRSSVPAPTPVQQAQSDTAIRRLGDAAAGRVTRPWRTSIRQAARSAAAGLPDALDQAVTKTDLGADTRPRWWTVAGFIQWLALAAAAAGGLWLLAIAGASFLQIDVPVPKVQSIAIPTLLLLTGVLAGIVVGVGAFALARVRAGRRAASARRQLHAAVENVTDDVVIKPVEAELERYKAFRDSIRKALSR